MKSLDQQIKELFTYEGFVKLCADCIVLIIGHLIFEFFNIWQF